MSACQAIEADLRAFPQARLDLDDAKRKQMERDIVPLIDAWTGAVLAVVVDAVRVSGPRPPQPGQVHRGRLIVHAIEAADLTQGSGLTPAVAAAVDAVARAILDDLRSFAVRRGT
jgi:phosphatidylethanolamine-binding protein (PEBP) family uncharacterized protein